MPDRLKLAALALVVTIGLWLAYENGIADGLVSSWNCAGSKALVCLQR